MKNFWSSFTIKHKLLLVIFIPIMGFLIVSIYNIQKQKTNSIEFKEFNNSFTKYTKINTVIKALAEEREKSFTYVINSNKTTKDEMILKRAITNKKLNILKKNDKYLQDVYDSLEIVRFHVDNKNFSLDINLNEYTDLINSLIHLSNNIKNNISNYYLIKQTQAYIQLVKSNENLKLIVTSLNNINTKSSTYIRDINQMKIFNKIHKNNIINFRYLVDESILNIYMSFANNYKLSVKKLFIYLSKQKIDFEKIKYVQDISNNSIDISNINIDSYMNYLNNKLVHARNIELLLEKKIISFSTNKINKIDNEFLLYIFIICIMIIFIILIELNISKEILKNIKKEQELNTQILNSEKMVQLGEMIGNIAHQWRQPLSVITTLSSVIQFKISSNIKVTNVELENNMKQIEEQSKYLSNTINTFMNFIKDKKEIRKILIQNVISESFNIIGTVLKDENIKLKNNIGETPSLYVTMAEGELIQVLINIINNAKDAILANKIENGFVNVTLYYDDNFIYIAIKDNGGGIPTNVINKIFNPYFTTKHQSKGTGLGLHMSYRIITESFKGTLEVNNYSHENYSGAKFTISIPKDKDNKIENK